METRYVLRLSKRFDIRCRNSVLAARDKRNDSLDFSGPGLRQALRVLADRSATFADLQAIATAHGGKAAGRELKWLLERVIVRKLLDGELWFDQELMVVFQPAVDSQLNGADIDLQGCWRLGRHCFLRWDGDNVALESAMSGLRILIRNRKALMFLYAVQLHGELGKIVQQGLGLDHALTDLLLTLLARLGFVERADAEQSEAKGMWEFHDLLFHFRSRSGYSAGRLGATYRLRGESEPLPAIKPPMSSETIQLKKPSRQSLSRHDAPLSTVMAGRESRRDPASNRLPDACLSEFLYRCAGTDRVRTTAGHETLRRSYPGAGSIHELEYYVAVDRCEHLEKGLYHYDGLHHVLFRLPSEQRDVSALLDHAAKAWGKPSTRPHVLVILAARFGRIMWKYEGLAYRLILLDAGVAMQTMYLVATAMGLGPCALGDGDSKLFARATGLDPFVEGSVAEFAISGVQQL